MTADGDRRSYGKLTAPRAAAELSERSVLCLPVGSFEQHGTHLPLDTDTVIAERFAARLAAHVAGRHDLWVVPPVPYGLSPEHAWAPGTVTLDIPVYTALITTLVAEYVRSTPVRTVIVVNGHGGNRDVLEALVHQLRHTHDVAACVMHPTALAAGGTVIDSELPEIHAGIRETSLMLALAPDQVRLDLLPADSLPDPGRREEIQRLVLDRGVTWPWTSDNPRSPRTASSAATHARPAPSSVGSSSPPPCAQANASLTGSACPTHPDRSPYGGTMTLTSEEKTTFKRDGVVVRRGLVDPDLVGRAVSLVDTWYSEGLTPEDIPEYTQRTFAPELGSHPDVLALYAATNAARLTSELLGQTSPVTAAQIQIRVPEAELPGVQPEKAMHVDGVSCPHLDPRELRTFSLLIGVVLSDISDAQGGALRYLPGGHHTMARWFGDQWSLGMTKQVPPEIDREHGVSLLGAPGDVLLMHHLVPHSVGRNLSPSPRVMAYFRVSHPDHSRRRLEALRDPWLDYPPLASIPSTPAFQE
ncbi:creatininase family protein [Streptomyces sp. NPDC059909]|uniref:creatininase family protein n=1 Tax=Streptomyces sp. NPDC059909 TaxID=3346998 RepID=UPI0036637C6E